MRDDWESGLRGRIYALGRRLTPLSWRRALRRRVPSERLLGLRKPAAEHRVVAARAGPRPAGARRRRRPSRHRMELPAAAAAAARRGPGAPRPARLLRLARGHGRAPGARRRRPGRHAPADRGPAPRGPAGDAPARTSPRASARVGRGGPRAVRARPGGASRRVTVLGAARRRPQGALRLAGRLRLSRRARGLRDQPAGRSWPTRNGTSCAAPTSSWRRRRRSGAASRAERNLPGSFPTPATSSSSPRSPPPSPRGNLTVGYVGAVDEWFDGELLARLAALSPDWRFEIVGGRESDAARVTPRSNVVFHGERPHAELPGLRSRFDVEIIPFRLSPLTHATDPVKVYEAAAAGRPVVATPMDSLRPFVAAGHRPARVDAASSSSARSRPRPPRPPRRRALRRDFARENTWDVRAAALDSWILNLPGHGVAIGWRT